ncbi:MAG: type II toxin-antitoxin system PrlF family antitoxin [Acidiferrobacteraceae bacterium]
MVAVLKTESSLTDRYQTTVPETVRRVLKLDKRDKICYTIRPSGEVVISRVVPLAQEDPVLGQFLSFLAHDIANHPGHVRAVDMDLVERIHALVGGIAVDLDAPLPSDDA